MAAARGQSARRRWSWVPGRGFRGRIRVKCAAHKLHWPRTCRRVPAILIYIVAMLKFNNNIKHAHTERRKERKKPKLACVSFGFPSPSLAHLSSTFPAPLPGKCVFICLAAGNGSQVTRRNFLPIS